MKARYSKKRLTEKLEIKQGYIISLINPPDDYGHLLFPIPQDCSVYDQLIEASDLIQYFTTEKEALLKDLPKLKDKLKQNGALWVSWPKGKKSINGNIVREIGLNEGLVDIKVIAVDEKWSGLKFVYRVRDRSE